ncbi:hypothetical protein CspHIS471_0211860 [Cutaneotrichosporon sp. HIS471]|nr:hypothetical protein CspHIS471_0211860 [Cutaneotrichosporon sp. HIS471]
MGKDKRVPYYGSLESDKDTESLHSDDRRQIGLVSAVFIILNRMIGTGVFATPSTILNLSGSVGMSLVMWVVGSIIAAAGINAFEGTTASASSFCLSLYNVIWSFVGYHNANFALSEVKNPKRTIRIAGPMAIGLVTVLYILANIAYFAAASKEEITGSGTLVASLLFHNVYGDKAARFLDIFVALSALGNVLSVIFAQGRVNQELGREGVLPFSRLWASNKPLDAPLAGLALHWAICLITILALPPGDAYNFVINTISYPLAVINATIAFGIVYLHFRPYDDWKTPGWPAVLAAGFFGAANVFLLVVPFTPPPEGGEPYATMPYYTHAVAGWAVFGIGFIYWLVWAHVLPRVGGYTLVRELEVGGDGLVRNVFRRVKN